MTECPLHHSTERPRIASAAGWIIALLLLAGCRLGPQAKDFKPANEAGGVTATVRMPSQTVTGELLEVRDSAIVLLGAQVMLVPDRADQDVPVRGDELREMPVDVKDEVEQQAHELHRPMMARGLRAPSPGGDRQCRPWKPLRQAPCAGPSGRCPTRW